MPSTTLSPAVPNNYTPPQSPSPSPSQYLSRQSSHTATSTVDASKISFLPSSEPGSHPYDSPTLKIDDPATLEALKNAADLLGQGKCVAFPTETVYGLGADATSTVGVNSIYAAKQRPLDNPLIVHVGSLRQLRGILAPSDSTTNTNGHTMNTDGGEIPEVYDALISKFWPGPLTILLPLPTNSPLSAAVTAGQPKFAARLPSHPIAQALCHLSSLPLAAPSANASGNPSPTSASHVFTDLRNRIPLIIDGGPCSVGLESTVVDGLRDPPVVLRPGGISVEAIRELGGVWARTVTSRASLDDAADSSIIPEAPGMKYKHYSPRAGVILYEFGTRPPCGKDLVRSTILSGKNFNGKVGILRTRTWKAGIGELTLDCLRSESSDVKSEFYGNEGVGGLTVVEMGLGKGGEEIGRGLFAALRELDDAGVDVIHVEGIEEVHEGLAIMNRLRKAASVVVRTVW
ncbi:DHBP synthase RibB-like alpha/beta domain-containing protein [Tuber borchii]|uniref:Threonylcarbamoyl-AMP synthase n=1 Tax=Tuber borchii TaxID=42251 RepID=A0A2T6ZNN8_TUBBO|nr:DHBP synthase RibB-like alpha/beta domain-containing protein [Tuber borchii]